MSTARSLNKVMIVGNLTRNPVLKRIGEKDSVVCTFGVATNSTWKDSEGNIQERTEFHNIVSWNKLGEICAQLLATGMLVYLEGELRTRTWDGEDGQRRYRVEIKLNDMKLLDGKGKRGVGIEEAQRGNESKNERSSKPKTEKSEKDKEEDKKEDKKGEEENKIAKGNEIEVSEETGEDLF